MTVAEYPWIASLDDVFDAPDIGWLVDGFMAEGMTTRLIGETDVGKSLLALHIALQVAIGRPAIGLETRSRNVLYLDYENGISVTKERLERYGYTAGGSGTTFLDTVFRYAPFPDIGDLTTQKAADTLVDACQSTDTGLVVIDSLAGALNTDENSSTGYTAFGSTTRRELKKASIATLILDHSGHTHKTRSRGSSRKREEVELDWTMTSNGTAGGFVLSREKDRRGQSPPRIEMTLTDRGGLLTWEPLTDMPLTANQQRILAELVRLDADPDITDAAAKALLKDDNVSARHADRGAALRHLKKGG